MPANDPWSRSILSASPSSSSETDDDAPTDNRSLPYNSLSRNADLARELDLGTRDDRAVFKQTPFTLAKMRGGKTNGSTRANESKTKGNIVPATSVNHKGKTEQVVEKQKAGPAEEREPSYKPKWQKNTGWYNAHNKPIPLGPPPKRSILSSLDEEDRTYQSKALGTKSKKAAKKPGEKGKKGTKADEEERPVFKRIPANAAPTDRFPIVQGLERQRTLPVKAKATGEKRKGRLVDLSPDSTDDRLPDIDIDALVRGVDTVSREKGRKKEKGLSSDPAIQVIELSDDSGETTTTVPGDHVPAKGTTLSKNARLSDVFPQAKQMPELQANDKSRPSFTHTSTHAPSLRLSGPTAATDTLETPPISSHFPSDPSTMTHVASFDVPTNLKHIDPNSSSSGNLPYSSPLVGKTLKPAPDVDVEHDHLIRPIPKRTANPIENLEALATLDNPAIPADDREEEGRKRRALAEARGPEYFDRLAKAHQKAQEAPKHSLSQISGNTKRTRSTDQSVVPRNTVQKSDDRTYPDRDPYKHPTMRTPSPEWSTLPTKRPRGNLLVNPRSSTPKLTDKFRMPLKIFGDRDPPSATPPAPAAPRFVMPKSTLFTPSRAVAGPVENSKSRYVVHTARGSKYGAVAGAQQDEQSARSYGPARAINRSPSGASRDFKPRGRQEIQSRQAQRDSNEDDWTTAWKMPSRTKYSNQTAQTDDMPDDLNTYHEDFPLANVGGMVVNDGRAVGRAMRF